MEETNVVGVEIGVHDSGVALRELSDVTAKENGLSGFDRLLINNHSQYVAVDSSEKNIEVKNRP